ncbi:MAG: flagellar hook basal-body protein [Candidatus Margulisbacteria bacterium]|nr:flagellar hook basal-body protein [Candidatus Margulisiibacteriota bacterium]
MKQSLFICSKAMDLTMERMSIISNNLANVNTVGYKKDNTYNLSFKNEFARNINNIQCAEVPDQMKQVTDYTAGNYRFTNDKLNMALVGDGFFKVQLPDGQTAYTRKGVFSLNVKGELVLGDNPVLSKNNTPIKLQDSDINVDSRGNIMNSSGLIVGQLNIVDFPKPYPLEKIGGTMFVPKEEVSEIPSNAQVRQQYLEESNVDALSSMIEMINLMEAMRQYESQQKMVQLQDDATNRLISDIART